jgi:RluA family pseudouridine synthase
VTQRWEVTAEHDGARLPEALFRHAALDLHSLKQARRLIDSGRCSINGRVRTFASATVHTGDWIEVTPEAQHTQPRGCPIIYEDDWLIVMNKPPGITVESASIERFLQRPCHLIHRLDKGTSGVLLVAKESTVGQMVESLFRSREVTKTYLAIVDGAVAQGRGTICRAMKVHKRYHGSVVWGVTGDGSGKRAQTEYVRLRSTQQCSLVVLSPKTGRTHQLRVHMASIGHPIIGDYQYADQFRCMLKPGRQLLHAWKLSLRHPMTGAVMEWTAPVPEDMRQAVRTLFRIDIATVLDHVPDARRGGH